MANAVINNRWPKKYIENEIRDAISSKVKVMKLNLSLPRFKSAVADKMDYGDLAILMNVVRRVTVAGEHPLAG